MVLIKYILGIRCVIALQSLLLVGRKYYMLFIWVESQPRNIVFTAKGYGCIMHKNTWWITTIETNKRSQVSLSCHRHVFQPYKNVTSGFSLLVTA